MNVPRRMYNGQVNPYEKLNTQVIYCTSAGTKSSYAYGVLIDTLENAIIDPSKTFCIGLDYRIPVMHGLISKDFVQKLKLSASYNEQTFAAEYLGQWQGGGDDSWYNFEKLSKYRVIKNPEWKARTGLDAAHQFYILSIDVGRIHDQTVLTVFRVNVRDLKFYSTLTYIEVLGRSAQTKTFEAQAIAIKKAIEKYKPRVVSIDTNGLGIGLADEMVKAQVDENGVVFPAYGFYNDAEYKKIQSKDAIQILYSMKANSTLKSKINGNAYSRLNSGLVHFLITEQSARTFLLGTQKGQKMTTEQRVKRLLPHEMTTKLFEEMANLRVKKTGLDINLEQINSRFPDDKYYSMVYGLWVIKELEDDYITTHNRRNKNRNRQLVFFSGS